MNNYVPSDARVRRMVDLGRVALEARLAGLDEALASGATSLNLPGLSGQFSHDTMESFRRDCEVALGEIDAGEDSSGIVARRLAGGPLAGLVNLGGRPIGY